MMRAFVHILRLEIESRRLALVAAALLGLLPLVAPVLRATGDHSPAALRGVAFVLVVAATAVLAPPLLGASLLSRQLDEGKLGFYFARPVGPAALWLAKVVAAFALLAAGLFLVAAPSLLVDGELRTALLAGSETLPDGPLLGFPESAAWLGWPAASAAKPGLAVVLLAAVALLASHVAMTLIRVRSAWLLLDVVLLALAAAPVVLVRDLLLRHQAYGPLGRYELAAVAAVAVALLAAGWWQVRDGRTDSRRSRMSLGRVMWPSLLLISAAGWAYAGWAVHPSFDDLEAFDVVHLAPDGRSAVVGGPVRHRAGSEQLFAVDLESGEGEAFASGWMGPSVRFAGDGDRLLWGACRRLAPPDCEIHRRYLRPGSEPVATGIALSPPSHRFADLSPSGELVALVTSNRDLSIHALASGTLVGSLAKSMLQSAHFLDAGRVLVVSGPEGVVRLEIWDLSRRTVEPLAELSGYWNPDEQRLDLERGRLLFNSLLPPTHQLVDLRTGELLMDLQPVLEPLGLPSRPRFLDDGRLLVQVVPRGSVEPDPHFPLTFLVFDPEAVIDPDAPEAAPMTVTAPGVAGYRLGPEVAPGRVVVGLRGVGSRGGAVAPDPPASLPELGVAPRPGWSLWLLDVTPGAAPSLTPVAGGLEPTAAPGLYLAADRAVVRWPRAWTGTTEAELALAAPESGVPLRSPRADRRSGP
ncbi:MAG: hypothetical protein AAFX50_04470 [Acidobacteriota bacterium]